MSTFSRILYFFRFFIAAFVVPVIISACTTLTGDIEVQTRKNSGINYDGYKTYNWAENAQIVFDPIGQWEQPTLDTDEEVRAVINRELQKHGINQVEKDPDLFIAFAAGADAAVLELKEDPNNDKKILKKVPKAALIIALIDADTGYTVWSGYAMGEVQQQQSIDNIHARINYAISKIFKAYNKRGLF